jgi:epoxyqueuosine reductase
MMMLHSDIVKILDSLVHSQSHIINAAWVPLKKPISFEFYLNWINQKKQAGMKYLETQAILRADPKTWADFAKSILIFQFPYLTHPWTKENMTQHLSIAKYAKGYDYHLNMIDELNQIIQKLKILFPEADFKAVTDSTPLLERDQAYQAGLGWLGKNTCLIHPKSGSFFLLGEILSSLEISDPIESKVVPNLCGKCNLCVEACPTEALSKGPTLDANLCLSYWNIESQDIPPDNIKTKMGSLFFGCDICQDVCPWNIKPLKKSREENKIEGEALELNTRFKTLEDELRFYLTARNRELLNYIQNTPLTRARPFGLRRNAIIVAVNSKTHRLKEEILSCLNRYPKLKDLKPWVEQNLT